MKLAKSHKIIFLITALALSVMLAFSALTVFTGKAIEPIENPNASNYFENEATAEFVDAGVKLSVDSNKKVSFSNELVISDMAIELGATENVKNVNLVLTYDSYYKNGNKNAEGKFDKEIVNTFDVTGKSSVSIKVENNVVKVDGAENAGDYYKISKNDAPIAKVSLELTLNDGATTGSVIVKSIDQKASNGEGKYKQSFVLVDGKLQPALAVVTLSSSNFAKDADGKYVAYANQDYSLYCRGYSVIETKTSGFTVTENDDITVADNDGSYIHFKALASGITEKTVTLKIEDKDLSSASYEVKVVNKLDKTASDEENSAPKYVYDELAIQAFKAELENQYIKDGKLVPLGTKINIPSMEDFVIDDRTPYDKLTKKIYYASKTEKSSTSLQFALDNVGDYYFYVLFTDQEEKGMDKSDFVELNDDGSVKEYGKYGSSSADKNNEEGYIFYFNIDEDKEIVITPPTKQGVGYKGTKYTASKFEILSAASNKNVFKLEYTDKENPTEEDWVEIKAFSGIEEDYNDGNYDYETLKKIGYNGEYTFTPDKVGKYRITVYVSSPLSVMSNSGSTIIEVKEEAKVINPSRFDWIKDNVWSVVFLSAGSLCLIGIVIILFIKPKDKKEDDE